MLIPRSRSAECLSAAENPTAEDLVPVNDVNQDRVTLVVPKTAAMTQVSTAEFFFKSVSVEFHEELDDIKFTDMMKRENMRVL